MNFSMNFLQCFMYKDTPAVASSAIAVVDQGCEASLVGGPETIHSLQNKIKKSKEYIEYPAKFIVLYSVRLEK